LRTENLFSPPRWYGIFQKIEIFGTDQQKKSHEFTDEPRRGIVPFEEGERRKEWVKKE
jgi:hypothetical protein